LLLPLQQRCYRILPAYPSAFSISSSGRGPKLFLLGHSSGFFIQSLPSQYSELNSQVSRLCCRSHSQSHQIIVSSPPVELLLQVAINFYVVDPSSPELI
jgi:hypothetical protein